MLDVIDAVLNLIEPGGEMDPATALRVADSGTTVDHSGAPAYDHEGDTDHLFAWPSSDRHETMEIGDAPSIRELFAIDLGYVVASQGEEAQQRRSREVSAAIDDRLHAYLGLVAANVELPGKWESLLGEINQAVIRGFSVRGAGLRLSGWRYLQGA